MEFSKKIQELRNKNKLTQEQFAEKLYVSRTAVSKWESGKGYPSIDSLKYISKIFNVSIDELLSNEEIIDIAKNENTSNIEKINNLVYGLLDIMSILFIFLPLYGQKIGEKFYTVSLISCTDIGNTIKEICNMADFVITTGGASVGDKDLIKEAIDEIDGEKLFWKIKIKPGSSVLCSKYNNTVIISLSGNPTAALTTFELLARTSLEKISGGGKIEIKREKAVLLNDFNKKSPQRRFLRGQLQYMDGKQCVYITQVKSGNGILSSTLNSNCIIELEAGNAGVSQGTMVDIIKF